MAKFRSPRIGSNVVHRLEIPGLERQRIQRRRRAAMPSRNGQYAPHAAPANGGLEAPATTPNGTSRPAAPEGSVDNGAVLIPAPKPDVPRPAALKDSQARHQIQLLERRLAKMARIIEERDEEDISRSSQQSDDGVPSIYREVQGVNGRGKESKKKRAFMSLIFEANLKLRERVTSASSDAE